MNLNSEETYKTINLVENLRQRIAHSWQLNGSNYQLNNTEIFIALKENAPVDQDQWVIAGTLLKDGTPVGQVAEDNADPSKLQVSLFMGNDKIILISINRF